MMDDARRMVGDADAYVDDGDGDDYADNDNVVNQHNDDDSNYDE